MKKLIFAAVFLVSCAVLKPVNNNCPTCPNCPVSPIVHDTIPVPFYLVDTILWAVVGDTTPYEITIPPTGGDDYPTWQAAANYVQVHPHPLRATVGNYSFSQTVKVINLIGKAYQQVHIDIRGACNAKDAPSWTTSNFGQTFDGPLFVTQQCKGCSWRDLAIVGPYTFPNNLTTTQVDTLMWNQWPGKSRSNPSTFLAIDFASDSTQYDGVTYQMYDGMHQYYIPGMSTGGSTGVTVSGCSIQNYEVGIILTPSNTQNGELIYVNDDQIGNCKAAYVITQAQSKECEVNRLKVWGNVHTIFDAEDYGFGYYRGDGANFPTVKDVNIAAINYELVNATGGAFAKNFTNVYAEGLHKIGVVGGYTSTHFTDCQFDLQITNPGTPSPDFVLYGPNVWFSNCMIRVYNGHPTRFVLNQYGMHFVGGMLGSPPVCYNDINQFTNVPPPVFEAVNIFYGTGAQLNSNNYDTIPFPWIGYDTVQVNADYTGYFINGSPAAVMPGDLLLTSWVYREIPIQTNQYPFGYVTSVSGDTVFLNHIGIGIKSGTVWDIYDVKNK